MSDFATFSNCDGESSHQNYDPNDVPCRMGNASYEEDHMYTELRSATAISGMSNISPYKRWKMNYHEAAIFLEEGMNNEKFTSHPKNKDDLPAYLIVHNHFFYTLDLVACLLLLSLVVSEKPAVRLFQLSVGVHASLELFALFVVAIQLTLRMRWLGVTKLLGHKRTLLKVVCLLIMLTEAIVIIIRQKSHFRVTRALRPMFLIDNHYCKGLRRFIRQILQSLPPILDMLLLILFFMLIFATLGYYLFSPNSKDPYFSSLKDSFISLFILLTTANYPDVMMPAYSVSRWSVVFFVVYLVINLYFLMNLMLAVVYENFTEIEKQKFRKLLLHKRRACRHAFQLLVSKNNRDSVNFRHFEGLMQFHRPKTNKRDVYLTFKTLDTDGSGRITLEEFYQVYDVCSLKWKPKRPEIPWYEGLWKPIRIICSFLKKIVTWKYFDMIINVVVLCQGIWQVSDAAWLFAEPNQKKFIGNVISIVFVSFYSIEMLMKMIGLGIVSYMGNGWNVYDFLVTLFSIAGLLAESFHASFYFIIILRPLRLLRLFKIKKRYRDVFGTVFILASRFVSVMIVLIIVYYFFAVIGLELFSHYDMVNCCQNSTVANEYRFVNGTEAEGYYYLNNFKDIFRAGVTLFELTVVNNWFIIMNGYASVSSEWSRIYFMTFYIVTMVVLQIIVAFILEAFLFRIQYKRRMGDMDKDTLVKVEISLSREELDFCYEKTGSLSDLTTYAQALNATDDNSCLMYLGERRRTKNSFYMKMYADEVKEWLRQEEDEEKRIRDNLLRMLNDDHNLLSQSNVPIDYLDLSRRTRSI